MNTKRLFSLVFALVFLFGTLSVLPGALSVQAGNGPTDIPAANQPWIKQGLINDEDGIANLSTAFVGKFQIPFVSYSKSGSTHIYQAHLGTGAVTGNCGFKNSWYCTDWQDSALVPGTVSNMATFQYPDSHSIKWVYKTTDGKIRGAWVEFMNDMTYVDDDFIDLIDIGKFGSQLIGAPSLQADGNRFELAMTVLGSSDLYPYTLVYMHYVGGSNTSCLDSGSPYQCDVIDESLSYGSMGVPSFSKEAGGGIGLAYYKGGKIMYAYPHVDTPLVPSNCGPGGDTWRCITIFEGTETGTVGTVVDLALGEGVFDKGLVFTYDDELIPVTIYHADRVGTGGNCGEDLNLIGDVIHAWHCEDLVFLYNLAVNRDPSYSIALDPDGNSVIAYDFAEGDVAPFDLNIVYPKARVGDMTPGWIQQTIEHIPNPDVALGRQASIALDGNGLGMIAYLYEFPYESDDLRIALQLPFKTFLPNIIR